MKIAFFHELSFGGARRVVNEYGKRLNKRHDTDLYYIDNTEDNAVIRNFGSVFFNSFTEKPWKGKDWRGRLYKDSIELIRLRNLHKEIAKRINNKKYDLVFVHPSKYTQAPFVLEFLNIPSVYFCQEPLRIVYDTSLQNKEDLSITRRVYEIVNRAIRKQIDSINIRKANLILANSYYSKICIEKAYKKKSVVCYLGVNEKKFRPKNVKKAYDVLFVGEKSGIEGYDLLKDAVKLFLRPLKIKFIARNTFGKSIIDDVLIHEYNASRVVVALSKNEPFGLIPLESMACGVPVIAVREGGFRESVVQNKTGILVNRSPYELYIALNKLLADKALRKNMGKAGRAHIIENWTWDKSVRKFEKTVGEFLNSYDYKA